MEITSDRGAFKEIKLSQNIQNIIDGKIKKMFKYLTGNIYYKRRKATENLTWLALRHSQYLSNIIEKIRQHSMVHCLIANGLMWHIVSQRSQHLILYIRY